MVIKLLYFASLVQEWLISCAAVVETFESHQTAAEPHTQLVSILQMDHMKSYNSLNHSFR